MMITLENLTKEELIEVIKEHGVSPSQSELNWIRYKSLDKKREEYWEESIRLFDEYVRLCKSGQPSGFALRQSQECDKKYEAARKKANDFCNKYLGKRQEER